MKNKLLALCCLLAFWTTPAWALKTGVAFNLLSDVNWAEATPTVVGICFCVKGYVVETGVIWEYWEPFLLVDTSSSANYSAMLAEGGTDTLNNVMNGKNSSSSGRDVNESTFYQAHGFLLPLMIYQLCDRNDYGAWWSEFDSTWQNDELAAVIEPEATIYANIAMQLSCEADAVATNLGSPLDAMPWCIGSGGSSYPLTGHVDNDNMVQAANTAAARLIYKLCRLLMICDPADSYCYGSCTYTPVWIKSHYKMYPVRPTRWMTTAFPVGMTEELYGAGLNPPYAGNLGSNDEFLWVVHRLHRCCSCCQ